eukprot:TRINITY_DN48922_c0_g2_i1.p1 TRINITY_DN48922_c0_g2~~TRINITY_DN48922_c0_g2_i1.p1  ORF type:complete len:1034 (-),score=234.72 TRINITY_DN48922_c0_g2_i1:49-3150(-)
METLEDLLSESDGELGLSPGRLGQRNHYYGPPQRGGSSYRFDLSDGGRNGSHRPRDVLSPLHEDRGVHDAYSDEEEIGLGDYNRVQPGKLPDTPMDPSLHAHRHDGWFAGVASSGQEHGRYGDGIHRYRDDAGLGSDGEEEDVEADDAAADDVDDHRHGGLESEGDVDLPGSDGSRDDDADRGEEPRVDAGKHQGPRLLWDSLGSEDLANAGLGGGSSMLGDIKSQARKLLSEFNAFKVDMEADDEDGELCAHSALIAGGPASSPPRAPQHDVRRDDMLAASKALAKEPMHQSADSRASAAAGNEEEHDALGSIGSLGVSVLDCEEQPVYGSGAYKISASAFSMEDASMSLHQRENSKPRMPIVATSDSATASTTASSTAASTTTSTPTPRESSRSASSGPRPFLRKGSRNQRSDVPGSASSSSIDPQAAAGRKQLRLSRAGSEPPAARGALGGEASFGGMRDIPVEVKVAAPKSAAMAPAKAPSCKGSTPLEDDWADTTPWDCRHPDLDLELDGLSPALNGTASQPSLSGEPPTSDVVKSYFNIPSADQYSGRSPASASNNGYGSRRHSHWEGNDAADVLYGGRPDSAAGKASPGLGAQSALAGSSTIATAVSQAASLEHEARERIGALDQQVKKYEQENAHLKRLQAVAEQTERDFMRAQEKLWREVEAEKRALHAEFDVEQAALKRERRRLNQNADRQRHYLAEEREAEKQRQQLLDRNEQLEAELKEKDKKWQRTTDRLQRQVHELTRKNQELQDEVKRANQQALQARETAFAEAASRSSSVPSARNRQSSAGPGARALAAARTASTSSASASPAVQELPLDDKASPAGSSPSVRMLDQPRSRSTSYSSTSVLQVPGGINGAASVAGSTSQGALVKRDAKSSDTGHDRHDLDGASKESPTKEVQEVRRLDGRTERIFTDGRREVEFANGLRKVIWTDGRTSVMFQNGDRKEVYRDGVVVYHYRATGAVQTTLPSGEELYHFSDGQFERHAKDGSKEIRFPNGTIKRIFIDGTEEVKFADGSTRLPQSGD